MPFSAKQFRDKIYDIFQNVTIEGKQFVDIKAGVLHKAMGDYPNPKLHRMNSLCNVMLAEFIPKLGDKILSAPKKKHGASLAIRYVIPRNKG